MTTDETPNRDPIEPVGEPELPTLPEPATYDQVLVALAMMEPLPQIVMIGQRLATMPSNAQGGMPVQIPKMVLGAWATQLRRLGIFCIPELATHTLVDQGGTGPMAKHTAQRMQAVTMDDLWEKAKEQSPALAQLVNEADTPEKRRKAMRKLQASLPVEQRIALERLQSHQPQDFEPK